MTFPGAPRSTEEAAAEHARAIANGLLRTDPVVCSYCDGRGKREERQKVSPFLLRLVTCSRCDGSRVQ